MQGHLEILLPKEVELADGDTPAVTSETYAEYPLIIVSPLGFVAPAKICTTPRPLGFVPLRSPLGFVPLRSPLGLVPLPRPLGFVPLRSPLGFVPLRARWDLYYRGRAGLQARVT